MGTRKMISYAFLILALAVIFAGAAPQNPCGKVWIRIGCEQREEILARLLGESKFEDRERTGRRGGKVNASKKPTLDSIAAIASATPSLSTLLAAVKAADLAATLTGSGDFTVFAPNNAAFAKLPEGTIPLLLEPKNKDMLSNILLRHVLPTSVKAGEIPSGTTKIKTVGGEQIEIINANGGVTIKSSAGSAKVIATDILANNGVVHLVDTVF